MPADAAAGVTAARAAGARHVVLMGASVGARASIAAAAMHPAGVAAAVSLSAERTVRSDPTDLLGRARRVTVPTLLIAAREDPFVAGATLPLLRATAAHDKQALIVGGLDHGTALLTGAAGARVTQAILRFVAGALSDRPSGRPASSRRAAGAAPDSAPARGGGCAASNAAG